MPPLRPQDVVVALQLALTPDIPYRTLSAAVGLSQGETHNAVKRLIVARLLRPDRRAARTEALFNFLTKGVPHAFPAELGAETRGVPTAHAAPPLASEFAGSEPVVWPFADGDRRGASLEPLHEAAPRIAQLNPALYELLALVDALRVGRARERQFATTLLRERLKVQGASSAS